MSGDRAVRITTPFGTDLSLGLDKRPVDYVERTSNRRESERGE